MTNVRERFSNLGEAAIIGRCIFKKRIEKRYTLGDCFESNKQNSIEHTNRYKYEKHF